MATIRKHRGKWQVQVRRNGRPAASRSFTTYADAERWGRETEIRLERGELQGDLGLLRTTTLGDLLGRYRDHITPSKRSAVTERYRINLVLKQPISKLSIGALSREVMAAFRDEQLARVSSETARQYLVLLRQVIETARREWGIPLTANPVDGIKRPPGAKARSRRIVGDELDRLRACLVRQRKSEMTDVVFFALATGLRRGEILRAAWADVNLVLSTLHVREAKNGEPRTIPLSPNALEILRQRMKADQLPEGKVFHLSPNAVKLAWRRLCARAGVEDLRFHDLRHEAVSCFFEMGLSVPEVAMISGHKDVRMLMRYTHLRPADLAAKLAKGSATSGERAE